MPTESDHVAGRSRRILPSSPTSTLGKLLGVDESEAGSTLGRLVRTAHGREPDLSHTEVETFPHSLGSPATGGVYRVHGLDVDGAPWSLFCKVLQHVRYWPRLVELPPDLADHFADNFPWRSELELWDPRVLASLPAGLRAPVLHELVELGEDRVAVWQECVTARDIEWDDAAYARVAYLLGRWNARSMAAETLAVSPFPPGFALRMFVDGAVRNRALPALADTGLWQHPWLAPHRDLAAQLARLGADITTMLERLDGLPQALPHGDASPQNLLVPPPDDAAELVAIDVSFRSPHALGFDLGQLLVGLVHADVVPAGRLPGIAAAILPGYVEGLVAEGVDEPLDTVRDGFATSVLLRSGFDGLLYGELGAADPQGPPTPAFAQRIELTRFLAEQYAGRTA